MPRVRSRIRQLLALPQEEAAGLVAPAPAVPVRTIVRRFWPYARPYRRYLVLGLLVVAVVPPVEAAQIWMFKLVVDDVLVPRAFEPFVWIAALYVGLTALRGLVSFTDDYLSTWVGERFLLSLRTRFFEHLQGLSLDSFERRRLGDVISRLTGDVAAIESLVLSGVASLFFYALQLVVFAGLLVYLSWRLALVSLVVVPPFWLAARRFSRLIKQASREKRRRSGSISVVAEESLANIPLVQAYGRQATEVERFHRENLGSFRAQMASTRIKALFTPLVDLIEVAGALLVLAVGTWELSQGRLTLGGLLVFVAYVGQLYAPIRGLSRLTNTIYSASAGAERIIEFLDQRPSVRERPGALALGRARGVVEFDDVSFRYPGAARDALSGISFAVAPGETVALVGASGAGKSTLAKLLLRFYDPSEGRISLDGHDLRDLRLDSLRDNLAVLLQDALVFDGTVRDNIAYGLPGASEADVVRAAEAADAHEFVTGFPEGYDAVVGEKGRRLSGGQRQRIAIARAMVRDAPVLILDEPTTGLDVESAGRVLDPLRRLIGGRATLVISHSLLIAREATEIVVLDDGFVAEQGAHEDLLDHGGLYARLWRLHQPEREAVT